MTRGGAAKLARTEAIRRVTGVAASVDENDDRAHGFPRWPLNAAIPASKDGRQEALP
jgi:hypothetical protein